MFTPDKWLIVEHGDIHKVFATWAGGYLDGDFWRLNSGIEAVDVDGDFLIFYGVSGSVYICHKDSYGTTGYGSAVLHGNDLKALSDYEDYAKLLDPEI